METCLTCGAEIPLYECVFGGTAIFDCQANDGEGAYMCNVICEQSRPDREIVVGQGQAQDPMSRTETGQGGPKDRRMYEYWKEN